MRRLRLSDRDGFSLIELVIVIVIIGLRAAIAVPRFTRASQGSAEAALRADLKTLREAIELYAAEHGGDWPGLRAAGDGVGPLNGSAFERQPTFYTNEAGEAVRTPDADHDLGPYLRKIPPLPVGKYAGKTKVITVNNFTTPGSAGAAMKWLFQHALREAWASVRRPIGGSVFSSLHDLVLPVELDRRRRSHHTRYL